MNPLIFHGFPVAAEFGDISLSYNKATASQVNIKWSQVKVNSLLLLFQVDALHLFAAGAGSLTVPIRV